MYDWASVWLKTEKTEFFWLYIRNARLYSWKLRVMDNLWQYGYCCTYTTTTTNQLKSIIKLFPFVFVVYLYRARTYDRFTRTHSLTLSVSFSYLNFFVFWNLLCAIVFVVNNTTCLYACCVSFLFFIYFTLFHSLLLYLFSLTGIIAVKVYLPVT